jgi:hypothetical protein
VIKDTYEAEMKTDPDSNLVTYLEISKENFDNVCIKIPSFDKTNKVPRVRVCVYIRVINTHVLSFIRNKK